MDAIRQQESGGNYAAVNASSGASGAYQFSFSTWQQALALAGLANTVYYREAAALAPASVQDAAARALMSQYYSQFGGSWYSVAEAWYGGPGAVGQPGISGGPGYPSVGQYASSVIAIYNSLGGSTSVAIPAGIPPTTLPLTAQFSADVGSHYLTITQPAWSRWLGISQVAQSVIVTTPGSLT